MENIPGMHSCVPHQIDGTGCLRICIHLTIFTFVVPELWNFL